LDFVPNCETELIIERTEKFYRIIRDRHPDTPIFFVENPVYPLSKFDLSRQNNIREKNEALRMVFDGLKSKKEKNIRYVPSAGMIGTDNEATVDGVHFTDLGFQRYADYLFPMIRKIIGK